MFTDLLPETQALPIPGARIIDPMLQAELEQFLFFEAELLDDRKWSDWYQLLAEDISYWMPIRRNRLTREQNKEFSKRGEAAHFDENKLSLGWRVKQLNTGKHWAEDPPSRTRHVISNVRIEAGDGVDEYRVKSNFLCYRNRLEDEVDIWAGERQDVLRRTGPLTWQVAARTIILDQNVILSKNLSVFF